MGAPVGASEGVAGGSATPASPRATGAAASGERHVRRLRVLQYVDPPGLARRLDGLDRAPGERADAYLLSHASMVAQLEDAAAFAGEGGPTQKPEVHVVGSTHIEGMLQRARDDAASGGGDGGGADAAEEVAQHYGAIGGARVVTLFSGPREPSIDLLDEHVVAMARRAAEATRAAARLQLAEDATCAVAANILFVVRPHPRTHAGLHEQLRHLCAAFDGGGGDGGSPGATSSPVVRMLYDEATDADDDSARRRLDNAQVIRGSALTLSIGSGTALESLSFGTPAAFLQDGWPGAAKFQSANYAWLEVPRIGAETSAQQLQALLFSDDTEEAEGGGGANPQMDVLRSCADGALAKTWAAIERQIEREAGREGGGGV